MPFVFVETNWIAAQAVITAGGPIKHHPEATDRAVGHCLASNAVMKRVNLLWPDTAERTIFQRSELNANELCVNFPAARA
jgi:hypothetical protein